MYSKHYFVFFDKTNDFTIDEFGNIGRTMEDGPFNSNEIGRHVDTETIFMVRANAEKLVNAWEGLDVYYIGDNVIHMHGQPLGYISITTPTTKWTNTTNRNQWIQRIKDYIWGIYNKLNFSFDSYNRGTWVSQIGESLCQKHEWCKCCTCECDCNQLASGCWNKGRTGHLRRRHYQQLCLTNNNVRRCYDIWQTDNHDARLDMWHHALKDANDFNAVWDVTNGFRWIYWLY